MTRSQEKKFMKYKLANSFKEAQEKFAEGWFDNISQGLNTAGDHLNKFTDGSGLVNGGIIGGLGGAGAGLLSNYLTQDRNASTKQKLKGYLSSALTGGALGAVTGAGLGKATNMFNGTPTPPPVLSGVDITQGLVNPRATDLVNLSGMHLIPGVSDMANNFDEGFATLSPSEQTRVNSGIAGVVGGVAGTAAHRGSRAIGNIKRFIQNRGLGLRPRTIPVNADFADNIMTADLGSRPASVMSSLKNIINNDLSDLTPQQLQEVMKGVYNNQTIPAEVKTLVINELHRNRKAPGVGATMLRNFVENPSNVKRVPINPHNTTGQTWFAKNKHYNPVRGKLFGNPLRTGVTSAVAAAALNPALNAYLNSQRANSQTIND